MLLYDIPELFIVHITSFLSKQEEGLGHGVMRPFIINLTDWEEITRLWVFKVALLGIDSKFVIQTKDFSLSKHDLCLFLFLKFSKLKNTPQTLNFNIFSWGCRSIFDNLWSKSAILLFIKLFLATFLRNSGHLSLLLRFEILWELLTVLGCILRSLFLIFFLASEIYFRLKGALLVFLLLIFLPQLFFSLNSLTVLRSIYDWSVWCNSLWNLIYFRLESQLLVHFLLHKLLLDFLPNCILIVQPVYFIVFIFLTSGGVRLADYIAQHINLGLKLVLSFFGILIPQNFALLALSDNEFCLSCLKIFEVSLIQVVLLGHNLACIGDGWLECVGIWALNRLVLHRTNAHLRLHITLYPLGCIVIETINDTRGLNLLVLLNQSYLFRFLVYLRFKLVLQLRLFSLYSQPLQPLILFFLDRVYSLVNRSILVELILVNHSRCIVLPEWVISAALTDQIGLKAALLHHKVLLLSLHFLSFFSL